MGKQWLKNLQVLKNLLYEAQKSTNAQSKHEKHYFCVTGFSFPSVCFHLQPASLAAMGVSGRSTPHEQRNPGSAWALEDSLGCGKQPSAR